MSLETPSLLSSQQEKISSNIDTQEIHEDISSVLLEAEKNEALTQEILSGDISRYGELTSLTSIAVIEKILELYSGDWLSFPSLKETTQEILLYIIKHYTGENLSFDSFDGDESFTSLISQFRGKTLSADGITNLSEKTASALSRFSGESLSVNGITVLLKKSARALSHFSGEDLFLNGISRLDKETAHSLTFSHAQRLFLDSLKEANEDIALALASFSGEELHLFGLSSLSKEALKELLFFQGKKIYLSKQCQESFDVVQRRIIGKHPGKIVG
jgi:hypothetical protein